MKEYKEALTKFPDNWTHGPNVYFNEAESDFWLKNYKASLDGFREFLAAVPDASLRRLRDDPHRRNPQYSRR